MLKEDIFRSQITLKTASSVPFGVFSRTEAAFLIYYEIGFKFQGTQVKLQKCSRHFCSTL